MKSIPTWAKVWIGSALVVVLFIAFRNKPKKKPKKILFVGDSLTAIEYNGRSTNNYPNLIRRKRPDLTIDVLAKGGMTTKWMLTNLPNKLFNKYDRVYIYGGVNDAFNNVPYESVQSNLQKMIDMIRDSGAEAYVVMGYEPSGFMDWKKMPTTRYVTKKEDYIPLVARYVELQKRFSALRNATLVDKFQLSSSMTGDGTHPNGKGQELIAEKILKTIE